MTEPNGTRPFSPFEWMLSLRYLRARRKEGFISVIAGFSFLGIMLGVATLIIVMAVMNGFRKELLDKILGLNGHLLIQPLEKPLTDWEEVAAAYRRRTGHQARSADRRGPGARVLAVQCRRRAGARHPADGSAKSSPRSPTTSSRARSKASTTGRASRSAAGSPISFRCASGDNITLVAPRGAVTPMGTTPRIKVYKIAAVFEIGMSEYDSAIVFMPLHGSAGLFQSRRRRDRDRGLHRQSRPRRPLSARLVQDAAQRPIFMIDWRQRNATFFNALQVERNVMFLILTLIVLVAALNIISGLIMLVKDKGQRHRHPAHHGRDAGRDHARLPDHRRVDRRGRHDRRAFCSAS